MLIECAAEALNVADRAPDREYQGDVDESPPDHDQIDDPEIEGCHADLIRVADDQAKNADHLEGRFTFAPIAGGDDDTFGARDAPEGGDGNFSSEQKRDGPGGDTTHRHEPYQGGHHQKFVSQRIEELPKQADDAHATSDDAVEQVREGGPSVDEGSPGAVARGRPVDEPQHERDDEDAGDRQ